LSYQFCLVADEGVLQCTFAPDVAKRLLIPLPSTFPDIPDSGSNDLDGKEGHVFVEECAGLLNDFEAQAPESNRSEFILSMKLM
jgi:hypothetical protein